MKTVSRRDVLAYSAWIGSTALTASSWPSMSSAAANSTFDTLRSSAYLSIGDTGGPIASVLSIQASNPSQLQLAIAWRLPKPLAEWMGMAIAHKASRQQGRVLVLSQSTQLTEYTWADGVVTQVQFPACDATSSAVAYPTLTVQARTLTAKQGAPQPVGWGGPLAVWHQLNFQVGSNASSVDFRRAAAVSPVTLAPGVRGGTVAVVLDFGTERPDLVTPLVNAVAAGGQLLADQSTDITVQYLQRNRSVLSTVTLRGCRLTAVMPTPPQPAGRVGRTTLTFVFTDASFSTTTV